jgi:hypothetical protein
VTFASMNFSVIREDLKLIGRLDRPTNLTFSASNEL